MKIDIGEMYQGKVRDGYVLSSELVLRRQKKDSEEYVGPSAFSGLTVNDGPYEEKLDDGVAYHDDWRPLEDDEVLAVWSDCYLQTSDDPHRVLREIVRVCKVGAAVEIKVPHWLSPLANAPGNRHTITKKWFDTVDCARQHSTIYPGDKGLVFTDSNLWLSVEHPQLGVMNPGYQGRTNLLAESVPGYCDFVTYQFVVK